MGIFKEKADKKVIQIINAKYSKINVLPGTCRFNFRCHNNAVHDAINNKDEYIAMVIYLDEGQPIIHFVNVDKKGVYTDNTLGQWSQELTYYFVRTIPKDSFFHVYSIFEAFRREIHEQLPFYLKPFINLDSY